MSIPPGWSFLIHEVGVFDEVPLIILSIGAMSKSEKQDIETLVRAGQTAEAVDRIVQYSNNRKLSLIVANFRHHHEQYVRGLLTYRDYTVEANKMNDFLLDFLI